MKDYVEVPLTRGGVAIIDACDAPFVLSRAWRRDRNGYAMGHVNGKRRLMHRVLLNAPAGLEVDHIDRNPLNNRRSNLRLCTRAENCRNTRPIGGTSQYRGVSWWAAGQCWRANIQHNRKQIFLGNFQNELDAARAYDHAAARLHGEFAFLNFPEGEAA